MSANRHRGQISVEIAGKQWTMCLTLGALAELETAFGAANLSDLVDKIASGNPGSTQLIAIIGAGLRGGGHEVSNSEIAAWQFSGGLVGMVKIVGDLIAATFGGSASAEVKSPPHPTQPQSL
jgi:hypothetical protein